MKRRTLRWVVIIAAIWLLLWGAPRLAHFYVDWLWFGEVGYRSVFWRAFWAKLSVGLIFGLGFFAIVYGNCYLARRLAVRAPWHEYESRFRLEATYEWERFLERWLGRLALGVCLFAAYVVARQAAAQWLTALLAFNPTTFAKADPLFGRDLSFYVFRLPLIEMAQNYLAGAFVMAIIFSAAIHYLDKAIRMVQGVPAFAPHVKAHLSLLLSAWFLTKAWDYRLQAFNLLFSERGVVFGATYADVHGRLFACYALLVVAVLGALAVLVNLRLRGFVLPLGAIAFLVVSSLLASIYPAAIQRFRVAPSEQSVEAPYIARNIEATRFGFGLQRVKDHAFPALKSLTPATLEKEEITLQNVRLWDHRPLLETYKRKQELQPYYHFNDVDIDRYLVDGQYRQVMLSPREINLDNLPDQRWPNKHIKYTHGYGLVLSPVNEVTGGGEPRLLVRDVPPVSNGLPKVRRPEIYFGEIAQSRHFSLVRTNLPEIDYPLTGEESATTTYEGRGGVPMGSGLRRLAMSFHFQDINLLLSANITPETKIIFRRSLQERLRAIAPFLGYDADPYMVLSRGGRLFWIQDAYTISGRLPYSQPFPSRFGRLNYMRNSVKVVVDAYAGSTRFFIADEKDPLLASFRKVFPGVFLPLEQMPENLREHLRYPEELFNLQARVHAVYHMTEAGVFYTKQDKWEIAREKPGKQALLRPEYGAEPSAEEGEIMQAYYALMRLPGEKEPEFILMIPFTPLRRPNMVAWMAARCDPEHYGELITYEFPRREQVWGPIQFEAAIDQHGEISKLFSWWDQRGSQVVRGNLLVIPLGEAVLYVEPVFLKAQAAPIPQLKLVVVGKQEGETMRVSFGPSLERALAAAVGLAPPLTAETLMEAAEVAAAAPAPARPVPARVGPPPKTTPTAAAAEEMRTLAARAKQQYDRAQERLRSGDLAGFQRELERMEATLKEMAAK